MVKLLVRKWGAFFASFGIWGLFAIILARALGFSKVPGSPELLIEISWFCFIAGGAIFSYHLAMVYYRRTSPDIWFSLFNLFVLFACGYLLFDQAALVNKIKARDWHYTELQYATGSGDIDLVKSLINRGHTLNKEGWQDQTPLMTAALHGHAQIFKYLIRSGADIRYQNSENYDVAYYAALGGNKEILSFLVQEKFDFSLRHLNAAIHTCNEGVIKFLLAQGIDPNGFFDGFNPVSLAVKYCDPVILEALEGRGAKIDLYSKDCYSALTWAVHSGEKKSVELLLESGAELDGVNPCSGAPLTSAVSEAKEKTVKYLLSKGAKVNIGEIDGTIPIVGAAISGSTKMVDILLDAGANINRSTTEGMTVLHYAAKERLSKMVTHLLMNGADPTIKNSEGKTAEDLAQEAGWHDVVKVFREHHAEPNPE